MPISNEITKSASCAFVLMACGFMLAGAVLPSSAFAQSEPPVAEPAPTDTPVANPGAQQQRRDPCPMPSLELSSAPDDLAKVQADIDRYTLCVERAQLLQRLNDLALENQEKLAGGDGALSTDNPGMMLDAGEFEAKRDAILSAGEMAGGAAVGQTAPPQQGWVILSVFGSGEGLQARLSHSDGELAQVRQGDTLYDGSVVSVITSTGVTLTADGESNVLKWVETPPVTQE